MTAKKRAGKKARAKKLASKNQPLKTPAAKPVAMAEPIVAAEPVAAKRSPKWAAWIPLAVVAVPFMLIVVYLLARPTQTAAPNQVQTTSAPGDLRVVPGGPGDVSGTQAANALQPQPMGLQQTQPAQSTGGQNLQVQQSPDQQADH